MKLRTRLLLILASSAGIAVGLTLALQHRSLARDLEAAAAQRLERSALAVEQLVELHLAAVAERYVSLGRSPVLRTNLEVEDPPTLTHYAEGIRRRHEAERILFVDSRGEVVAESGTRGDATRLLALERATLLHDGTRPWVVTLTGLGNAEQPLGRLIAVEPLSDAMLARWSQLCGAEVLFSAEDLHDPTQIEVTVLDLEGSVLRVRSSLRSERLALERSRVNLFAAGASALAIALLAGVFLSRSLVSRIRNLQRVAEQIGRGDFAARIKSSRRDEIGGVSTAIDEMAEYLEGHASALEETNAELLSARDAAASASRAKSDFLANMSHEIRTPMTAILGYVDLLTSSDWSPEDRADWARIVRRNGEHLLELINSILDVSKIESGSLTSKRRPCRLPEILASVSSAVEFEAQAKQLDFRIEIEESCPEVIETDPTQLRQILINLLFNAIKFTHRGSVALRIQPDAEDRAERRRLRFDVIDTGIGIPASECERIFEPFSQVDGSLTRDVGGTGLGLTISRHLARALGGDIELESTPGAGSTFRLTIDAGPPQAAQGQAAEQAAQDEQVDAASQVTRGSVLVAEDSPDYQRLIRALLELLPVQLEIVENGQLACERALAEQAAGKPFDLILMDMQMPVLDGYEATSRLRAAGYAHPIVALTAHAMASDEQKCIDAGCDGFQTKPLDRAQLLHTLARYCG